MVSFLYDNFVKGSQKMCALVAIGSANGEITEKKSRFLAVIKEIHSESDAALFIEGIRKKYWDARHNCYAYVLGPNNETQRFSDDKEPQGTAGKPILDVLLGNDIHNAVIVVTRYFGGVLLGTGGLVRAYTDSSMAAVNALRGKESEGRLLPVLNGHAITFRCSYSDISRFESLQAKHEMLTVSKEYLDTAVYHLIIEDSRLEGFLSDARNATRGSFALDGDESVSYCPDGTGALIYNW